MVQTKCLLRGSLGERKIKPLLPVAEDREGGTVQYEVNLAFDVSLHYKYTQPDSSRKCIEAELVKDKTAVMAVSSARNPTDPWYQIHKECPSATRAECERFWNAHQGDQTLVLKHLKNCLEWRKMHNLDLQYGKQNSELTTVSEQRQQDREDWAYAWEHTWNQPTGNIFSDDTITPPKHKDNKRAKVYKKRPIPQYVHAYRPPDCPMVIQVMGARIDMDLASIEHHSLAVLLYLDRKFCRHSPNQQQRCTVWVDVRGAPGWANPTPFQLFPFISTAAGHLNRLFPGRLSKLIIYPLPKWAVYLWKMAEKVLPAAVSQHTLVIAGSERPTAPAPVAKMVEKGKVPEEWIQQMEQSRHQAMKAAAGVVAQ